MPANKYLTQSGGDLVEVRATVASAGASDAGEILALDDTGRLDPTVMPVGVGADTATILTSEAVAAGDFVNIHVSSGAKVRKADASAPGKRAHGYVLAGAGSGVNATVYFDGRNTAVTGLTPGTSYFLSATTPGLATATAPSTGGAIVQSLGVAVAATEINVEISDQPIILAA